MGIATQIAQLLLSLSILVILHEFGHFFFAKLFKTRVEKFYLFFDPWFSLFKIKRGDTEYGIGWVPLGGYVKISGMIDESMDKEQMAKPPEPYEFRSKKAWQRLLIMIGGVLVNFILAFLIYIATLFVFGEKYLPTTEVDGIWVDSLGTELGFQNGDRIISVNDEEVVNFSAILPELILSNDKSVQIERDGEIQTITLTQEDIALIIKNEAPFYNPRIPFFVAGFSEESPAKEAGIQIGDKIVGLNGENISYFDEFKDKVFDYKNKEVTVSVLRENQKQDIKVTVNKDGLIGVAPSGELKEFYEFETIEYGFFAAIPAGIKKGYREVGSYLKQLKLIFSPKTEAYKSVGSFISITKLFPKKWDWEAFWSFTAMLSIMLGVINLLPIPALDGGHVVFVLYEMIVGKKPSDKFMEYAQYVGMIILLALMVLAIGNDFLRHVF